MPSQNPLRKLVVLLGLGLLLALPAAAGATARQGGYGAADPTTAKAPSAVIILGTTHLASITSPTVLNDEGNVKGSPFGSGTIKLTYTLHPAAGVAETTFTITNSLGTISGLAASTYAQTRLRLTFSGAGMLTAGTGAYAAITSGLLEFNAVHSITGKKEAIAFIGTTATPSKTPAKATSSSSKPKSTQKLLGSYLTSLGGSAGNLKVHVAAHKTQAQAGTLAALAGSGTPVTTAAGTPTPSLFPNPSPNAHGGLAAVATAGSGSSAVTGSAGGSPVQHSPTN